MVGCVTIGISLDFGPDHKGCDTQGVNTQYVDCVWDAGGTPLLIPCIPDIALLADCVDRCDAILLIGGDDYPPEVYGGELCPESTLLRARRTKVDLLLAKEVLRRDVPVLGICGGSQLMCISMGGSLVTHIEGAASHIDGAEHEIEIVPDIRARKAAF